MRSIGDGGWNGQVEMCDLEGQCAVQMLVGYWRGVGVGGGGRGGGDEGAAKEARKVVAIREEDR